MTLVLSLIAGLVVAWLAVTQLRSVRSQATGIDQQTRDAVDAMNA